MLKQRRSNSIKQCPQSIRPLASAGPWVAGVIKPALSNILPRINSSQSKYVCVDEMVFVGKMKVANDPQNLAG